MNVARCAHPDSILENPAFTYLLRHCLFAPWLLINSTFTQNGNYQGSMFHPAVTCYVMTFTRKGSCSSA